MLQTVLDTIPVRVFWKDKDLIYLGCNQLFAEDSGFENPAHINNVTWAVIHVTDNSKEVVAGYIEDDVFYVVFLDKEHKFWPCAKKNT